MCHYVFTFKSRQDSPHAHVVPTGELPDGHLHIIHGLADEEEDDNVRDEEGAPSVLEGREGEAPDVAEPHGHGDAGHQELHAVGPCRPLIWRTSLNNAQNKSR